MAAPPPTDSLIAALLAAILGVFAPATGFVVTVLKPAPAAACSTAGSPAWQAQAQQLADQLAGPGSTDAQSLRQQLESAGVTPSARNLVAPTAAPTTGSHPGAGGSDWPELAAKLSGELANSADPEARKLAQAIGDPDTAPSTTRARTTVTTSAPRAARPTPGGTGAGGNAAGDSSATTAQRGPSRSAAPSRSAGPRPSAAQAQSRSAPCPAPSGRGAPSTNAPSAGSTPTRVTATGPRPPARPTTGTTSPGGRADQRWEQLAAQLAAALSGSTDPRAVDLQQALDRAGFPSGRQGTTAGRTTGSAPRPTSVPVPNDPGGGD